MIWKWRNKKEIPIPKTTKVTIKYLYTKKYRKPSELLFSQ